MAHSSKEKQEMEPQPSTKTKFVAQASPSTQDNEYPQSNEEFPR